MTLSDKSILYLINPLASDGQAFPIWKKIRLSYPALPKDPIDITKIGNLSEYINSHKPKIIVIAGGDGTIHSVCNAMYSNKQKPLISVLPIGFGNALSYCLGLDTIQKAIRVLMEQKDTVALDLMKTNIENHTVGVFNIGIGFDAQIVHNRFNFRYIGFRSYVLSALRSFIDYQKKPMTITIDNSISICTTTASLVIAKCPVIGKNYVVSPYAKLNDGFLDCTLFSTEYTYLRNLRFKGFKHPLYSEIGKVHFKASKITIDGDPLMQIDGDPTYQQLPIEIEILKKKIVFLRNDFQNIDPHLSAFSI